MAQAYWLLKPEDQGLGFARRTLASSTAERIAADLPERPGKTTIAITPLANDPSGVIVRNIRAAIANRGRYEVIEDSFLQRTLSEFRGSATAITKLEDAVVSARRIGADLVLFGEVTRFARDANDVFVGVDLRLAERDSGQAILVRHYENRVTGTPASLSYWQARLADSSKPRRVVIWCCFVLLLPVLTSGVIRRITAEESNAANALLLGGYAAVSGLLAYGLTGFWIASWWTLMVVVAGAGLAGTYTYKVATFLDQMRH